MTVNEISEVSRSWTRHYRVDGHGEDWHSRKGGNPGPSADLLQIRSHAVTVGIDADAAPLPEVAALIDRAHAWNRLFHETAGAAQQEWSEARARALAAVEPTAEALSAFVAVKERLRPWTQHEPMNVEAARPGRERRALLAAKELAEHEEAKASGKLYMATGGLYSLFARQAARAVEEVAALLPLPGAVWSALDPNAALADEPRNVLHRSEKILTVCHNAALYLRAMGVPGTDDQLMGDEPHMALTFRRWAEAHAHHHELRTIRNPLKLAYAVEHGWEPGLWTRGDLDGVDQGPARRRFVPAFMVRR